MAGIYGDKINNRDDFRRELELAITQHANLPKNFRDHATIISTGRQLETIETWTKDGGTPEKSDRRRITMGLQLHRAFEQITDLDLYAFQQRVITIDNYIQDCPSDEVAASEDNDDDDDDDDDDE